MAPVEPVMPIMRRRIRKSPRALYRNTTAQQAHETRSLASIYRTKTLSLRLKQMAEFFLRETALLRRGDIDLGEPVAPMPGPAGIYYRPAVGVVTDRLALGLDAWVERGRPGIADDVDRGRGIRPRQHGPDQLLQVRYIDILVDHHHVAPAISADVAHRRDMPR